MAARQGDPRRRVGPAGGGARELHRVRVRRRRDAPRASHGSRRGRRGRRRHAGRVERRRGRSGGPGGGVARGRARGTLRAPRRDRSRRHGHRAPGAPRRRRVRAARRDQADAAGLRQRPGPEALQGRAPDRRRPGSSEHRPPARRWRYPGGSAVLRDGARRRRPAPRVLPRARALRAGTPRPLSSDLRRRAVRPSAPGGPPRPEARQHPRDGRWRAQAPGLRNREAALGWRRYGVLGADRDARSPADPGVREPRAGPRPPGHDGQRHLLPRRDPLRASLGREALPDRHQRPGRARPARVRAGPGAAEHADGGALARPRRDRPEGDAQGAGAALPVRRGALRGHRPLSRWAAGRGTAALGCIPGQEVRPAPPHRRGRDGPGPGGGCRRRLGDAARGAPREGGGGPRRAALQRRPQDRQFVPLRVPRRDPGPARFHAGPGTRRQARARVSGRPGQGIRG